MGATPILLAAEGCVASVQPTGGPLGDIWDTNHVEFDWPYFYCHEVPGSTENVSWAEGTVGIDNDSSDKLEVTPPARPPLQVPDNVLVIAGSVYDTEYPHNDPFFRQLSYEVRLLNGRTEAGGLAACMHAFVHSPGLDNAFENGDSFSNNMLRYERHDSGRPHK